MSCRCQRSNVSGVAIVAILRSEMKSAGPKLAPQEPVFFDQIRDRVPLPAIQPAGEHAQHHLQRRGVDHGVELVSRAGLKDVGRVVEHYAHSAEARHFDAGTMAMRSPANDPIQ